MLFRSKGYTKIGEKLFKSKRLFLAYKPDIGYYDIDANFLVLRGDPNATYYVAHEGLNFIRLL